MNGYDYSLLRDVDANRHRFVPGNHENYPEISRLLKEGWKMPLGYCGAVSRLSGSYRGYGQSVFRDFQEGFFYIRGGLSIDRFQRTIGVDWFPEEEMTRDEMLKMCVALNANPGIRQRLVVSHECPGFLATDYEDLRQGDLWKWLGDQAYQPSRTAQMMEKAWKDAKLKPEVWVFGHHHCSMDRVVEGTRFICVPSLTKVELEF